MKYTIWQFLLIFAVVFFITGCGDNPIGMDNQAETPKNGAISGVISPTVSDAAIKIYQDGVLLSSIRTDDNGKYFIQNLPEGKYDMSVTATGYVMLTSIQDVHVKAGQTTDVGQIVLVKIPSRNNVADGFFNPARFGDEEEVIVLRIEGMT